MAPMYHEGSRRFQDLFDTRRLADRMEERIVKPGIDAFQKEFIESRDMFFLATADAEGRPSCSYKGGDPGFVRVLDERTLAFPLYDGNGMYLSAGNSQVNPHVGLLFISFEKPRRIRVSGEASVDPGDPLRAGFPGAQLVVRVRVREVFSNCPRYIHRFRKEEASPFVPRGDAPPPIPDWKRDDWARDVLPKGDPACE